MFIVTEWENSHDTEKCQTVHLVLHILDLIKLQNAGEFCIL